MRRIPRQLEPLEIRVLGALLEKEQTTPDVYPLTVNALVAACNQRSNREPVMDVEQEHVRKALGGLIRETLVWRTEGARSTRWRHNLDDRWDLEPRSKAVITELLLRGPQTVGELRSRCGRMVPFDDVAQVEEVLDALGAPPEALVRQLPRQPGQKGTRWSHRLGADGTAPGDADASTPARSDAVGSREVPAPVAGADETATEPEATVIERLEERLARLERRVEELEARG